MLSVLLSLTFSGVEQLREPARGATVVGRCDGGCLTVEPSVPVDAPTSWVSAPNRLTPPEGRVFT